MVARAPKWREHFVSLLFESKGLIVIIMRVFESPPTTKITQIVSNSSYQKYDVQQKFKMCYSVPNESLSRYVILPSLYGTWGVFNTKEFITLPSADKDLLMCCNSFSRSPSTFEFDALSELQ